MTVHWHLSSQILNMTSFSWPQETYRVAQVHDLFMNFSCINNFKTLNYEERPPPLPPVHGLSNDIQYTASQPTAFDVFVTYEQKSTGNRLGARTALQYWMLCLFISLHLLKLINDKAGVNVYRQSWHTALSYISAFSWRHQSWADFRWISYLAVLLNFGNTLWFLFK